jgi:hypothetical protein
MQKNANRLLMLCGLTAALMLAVVGTAWDRKRPLRG